MPCWQKWLVDTTMDTLCNVGRATGRTKVTKEEKHSAWYHLSENHIRTSMEFTCSKVNDTSLAATFFWFLETPSNHTGDLGKHHFLRCSWRFLGWSFFLGACEHFYMRSSSSFWSLQEEWTTTTFGRKNRQLKVVDLCSFSDGFSFACKSLGPLPQETFVARWERCKIHHIFLAKMTLLRAQGGAMVSPSFTIEITKP